MKQVKILHCADMHIGAELSNLSKKSAARKAEIKNTFLNILKICREEDVQLLLIAGDLFDNVHVPKNILVDIRNGFESLKPQNTVVAIAPGNHDPFTEDSPYALKDFWPDNVLIFKGPMENVELNSLGVRLWGAAFTGTYSPAPLLKLKDNDNKAPSDDLINICLIHGDLVATGRKSDYNPVAESQLSSSKMDYVALGHIHKQTEVQRAGDTHFAYPGCPEGRGFDELDEKGVYIGTVSKGLCKLEYRRTCRRMNVELHVDISEAANSATAVEIITDKMKARYGDNYQDNLYKVILEGMIGDNVSIDCDDIKAALSDVYYIKIQDRTSIKIDFESVSGETTLKSIFIRKMKEKINDAGTDEQKRGMLEAALRLGVKAFFGEVKYGED